MWRRRPERACEPSRGSARSDQTMPRRGAGLLSAAAAIGLLAVATLFAGPVSPAVAAPGGSILAGPGGPLPARAPGDLCSTEQWRNPANFQTCTDRLANLTADRVSCVKAPTPGAPDSGMAGWFATRPASSLANGRPHYYSDYGYAGYDYTTYDIGCVPTVMHPEYKFENTIANGEFLVATATIGAANAVRERAWDPNELWGWADPLVEKATRAIYDKVFTVFGAVTLVVVGLYLIWRARQSDMSATVTTAGWAILIMVAVTAIATWPTRSANAADTTLTSALSVVHDAVGPPQEEPPQGGCPDPEPDACADRRPPAIRASDTATEGVLYRNWLRGTLGSADSPTAQKYGPVLYDAKSFSWAEIENLRQDSSQRQVIIDAKATRWQKVAEQIKAEDPEAYEYLQGARGMERVGAGLIAILSAVFFSLFDLVASLLVLLGFLIFRWAVVAAPVLGTIGLLRPASSGIRRLGNVVIAAVFNIIMFGTGAAIYLFAVDLIMGTAALPGWLQVVLILLTGVVGWLLLRPYRRIAQLGGKSTSDGGGWQRLFLRDVRDAAGGRGSNQEREESALARRQSAIDLSVRPESRGEDSSTVVAGAGAAGGPAMAGAGTGGAPARVGPGRPEGSNAGTVGSSGGPTAPTRQSGAPTPARRPESPRWEAADVPVDEPSYAIYRPSSDRKPAPQSAPSRSVARRPESSIVPG